MFEELFKKYEEQSAVFKPRTLYMPLSDYAKIRYAKELSNYRIKNWKKRHWSKFLKKMESNNE